VVHIRLVVAVLLRREAEAQPRDVGQGAVVDKLSGLRAQGQCRRDIGGGLAGRRRRADDVLEQQVPGRLLWIPAAAFSAASAGSAVLFSSLIVNSCARWLRWSIR
jgi:hypothetical protein